MVVTVMVIGMTSTKNARELERLQKARTEAQERFAKQMRLLEQIEATAGEREAITRRWHGQLAALADLSGGASSAADLSGLPKAEIETAVKSVEPSEVQAAVEAAAAPTPRRRRNRSAASAERPAPAATGSAQARPASE